MNRAATKTVQRTAASQFARERIQSDRRVPPVADIGVMSQLSLKSQAMKRNGTTHRLSTIILLFWFFVLSPSSNATLIIVVRQNDALYVASDSALSRARQKKADKYLKCFPAGETCCVAISGFAGADGTIETTSNRMTFDLRFPQQLERIGAEEYARHELFSDSVTNILNRFQPVYRSFINLIETNSITNHEPFDETDIYIIGYDTAAAEFCEAKARFRPIAPYTFTFGKVSIPASNVAFKGEYGFLGALMRGDDPRLKPLKSKALMSALSPPSSATKDVQAKTICGGILQLYALHTKYAKRYNYDDGLVGPPYVIYRIGTNNVTRIYFGNGSTNSDKSVVDILLCLIVIVLIVGVIIFSLRG